LALGFLALAATALVGVTRWTESLLEAALIFAVFALLVSHDTFVATLARAPRALRLGALAMAGLWTWSQVHGVAADSYPFISWRMYGEPPKYRDFSGYRLLGEPCAGDSIVLPPSSGATGRRPILSLAVRRAYEASQVPGGDQARASARTDKLLAAILTRWNSRNASRPLCALSLEQTSIDVKAFNGSTQAQYTTVRRYVAP
jgi:hypothetical protein